MKIKSISTKLLSILVVMVLVASCAVMGGCGDKTETSSTKATTSASNQVQPTTMETITFVTPEVPDNAINVEMEIEKYGKVTIALYPDDAPITVENFVNLVNDGFYDGLTFHRIISGFMAQGGDPLGNGTGGSEKEIKGEFASNGVANRLKHSRGAISMARSQMPDSGSSQFFIVHQDSEHLDGSYAAFGYVTSGMEVIDKICEDAQPTDGNGSIAKDKQPVIKSIKVVD